jgi:hypothetical protein
VPLGYDVKDRKLIINEPEAATVRPSGCHMSVHRARSNRE